MELLDFPPEIFRSIIHSLVSDVGVGESWKLRRVCRKTPLALTLVLRTDILGTFDQEISESVLAIQPQTAFLCDAGRCIFKNKENVKHFLAYQVKNPRDIPTKLLAKTQKMVKYITEELDATNNLEGRNILLEVCSGIAYTSPNIQALLFGSALWVRSYNESVTYKENLERLDMDTIIHDKLITAISVGAYEVVAELLSHAPALLLQGIFAQPMAAAVLLDDRKMINAMISVLDRHKSKKFKKTQVLSSDSPYSILSAMREAIAGNRVEMVELLLGHLRCYMKLPDKTHYRKWINEAVSLRKDEALKFLLQAEPQTRPFHVNSRVFRSGCKTGESAIVNILLRHGNLQLDSVSTARSTLAISIRSGRIASVRTVVEAGADINMVMGINHIRDRPTITPSGYAIRLEKSEAVTYLIERGAKVPSTLECSRKMRKVVEQALANQSTSKK
jgi:hypothetical protein